MKWPQHPDYVDAVQHPATCFRDPTLREATPVCDRFGIPRATAGNFACVIPVTRQTDRWAVRCFTRAVPDVRQRYASISRHISARRLPSLVDFTYLEEGIRIAGAWYPVLIMEWVEGVTLPTYVRDRLHQPQELRNLSAAWHEAARHLRKHHIAHGDLQHGNIMVTPDGRIRLVDYDAMYVPAIRGEPSPELGHPNWQHPFREKQDYGPNMDRFASLVLMASLEALTSEPSLWARFHNGENLIFTRQDFANPRQSELFRALHRSHVRRVRGLAQQLEASCLRRPRRTWWAFFPRNEPQPEPAASPAPVVASDPEWRQKLPAKLPSLSPGAWRRFLDRMATDPPFAMLIRMSIGLTILDTVLLMWWLSRR